MTATNPAEKSAKEMKQRNPKMVKNEGLKI